MWTKIGLSTHIVGYFCSSLRKRRLLRKDMCLEFCTLTNLSTLCPTPSNLASVRLLLRKQQTGFGAKRTKTVYLSNFISFLN